MKRKHYIATGVTQDNDAGGHGRGHSHHRSRKCKASKRETSKKNRVSLNRELQDELSNQDSTIPESDLSEDFQCESGGVCGKVPDSEPPEATTTN